MQQDHVEVAYKDDEKEDKNNYNEDFVNNFNPCHDYCSLIITFPYNKYYLLRDAYLNLFNVSVDINKKENILC